MVTRLTDRSDKADRQMFREVAGRHAVEQPQQALFLTRSSPSLIMSATMPSMPGLLLRCKHLNQEHSSSRVLSSFKHALSKPGVGIGSHQSSEGFKLCSQLNWTSIAAQYLEDPPELTCVLGSHLTQLHIALALPRLLHPVSQRMQYLLCSHFFVLKCYAGFCTRLPFLQVLLCMCCQTMVAARVSAHRPACKLAAQCHVMQISNMLQVCQIIGPL